MMSRGPGKIAKILSANDIGLTGGHQGGILIPKTGGVLPFFPALDETAKNPRAVVRAVAPEVASRPFELAFIHYNNKVVESGTRDEYRLTGMTGLLRSLGPRVGDVLVLRRDAGGVVEVTLERSGSRASEHGGGTSSGRGETSSGWFIVEIE